jgi:Bacterial pre-peptidase C-terminal domain
MLNQSLSQFTTRAADDRPSGARSIGQLNGSRVFRGAVGIKDKNDFYSFTLSGRSSFNLALNKLKNNVDVSLIQGGKTLARSARGSRKPEAINTTLEAGTYFIKVSQKSGNSKYRLALNASLIPGNDPPGNDPPGTNPPVPISRRVVSLNGRLDGSSPSGIGFVDLNTGVVTPLPITGAAAGVGLTDVATLGNDIFVTSFDSNLYKVDGTTGNSTLIGNLGLAVDRDNPYVSGLAFTPTGALYGTVVNSRLGRIDGLYSVDLTSGRASLVGGFRQRVDDLAYDTVSGRFIAVSGTTLDTNLDSIGLNGDVQSLGLVGFSDVDGLLFDNGNLYGFSGSSQYTFLNFTRRDVPDVSRARATRDKDITGTGSFITGAA